MAKVDLGFGTSIDLEEGEGVICSDFDLVYRQLSKKKGDLRAGLIWKTNFVITSKRVVSLPYGNENLKFTPPQESWPFKDIVKASKKDVGNGAMFNMVTSDEQVYISLLGKEPPKSVLGMVGLLIKGVKQDVDRANAQYAGVYAANARVASGDDAIYTKKSLDKYYGDMEKRIRDKAKIQDVANANVNQKRDYLMELINECAKEAKK
jgi:hypothetical protein